MSEAALILAINLLLGLVIVGALFAIYLYNRSARQHLFYAIGFSWAIGSGLLEMALPYVDSSLAVRYATFVTFLIALVFVAEGLALQYRVRVDRRLVATIVVAGLLLNIATLFMARNSPARMILYQAPYVALSLTCAWTAFRGRGKRFGDRALVALLLLFTLHFASRPLAAIASGGMGSTASDYLSTFYALTTQFDVAVLTIAIAATLIGLAVADVVTSLERNVRHDALTNILNRRGFDDAVRTRLAQRPHSSRRCCLVACDLDNFKSINDSLGHGAGDTVIKAFAATLAVSVRKEDFCGRMGGEEFAVFIENLDIASARLFAEGVRTHFAATPIADLSPRHRATASFGVTDIAGADDIDAAYARADRALYAAKHQGRNRVECEPFGRRDPGGERRFTAG